MQQTAIEWSKPLFYPNLDSTFSLELNYNEFKCLEMAIELLQLQLGDKPHHYFTKLRDFHVRNISHWLNKRHLMQQLRVDGNNSVSWPVASFEDIEWLALALEEGATEDTLKTLAADCANYEKDMAMMYAEDDECCSLADVAWYDSYTAIFAYYCHLLTYQPLLSAKLRVLLEN